MIRGGEGLKDVLNRIARAEAAANRPGGSVSLVAVSKKQPKERIEAVLAAGHRVFGENRVQEAEGRWPTIRERVPDLELHLVGPLQSNKARTAIALFDVIQSLDRPRLARRLADLALEIGRIPRIHIQVNTGEEPQKSGVLPQEVDSFVRSCREELELPIEGLMAIPPIEEEPAMHFALLEKLARRNGLDSLSMGMSADFEAAIAFGATHVRVGIAVFGARS